jgi:PadR family transcriptional regulator PadR
MKDKMDALHGYGIARRIEQISGDLLNVNRGTFHPVLLKRDGCRQLLAETQSSVQTAAIIARFFAANAEDFE